VHMRRREFISRLGGAAVVWPLAARAQQAERMRQISVLMGLAETDPFTMGYVRELHDGLQQLGWTDSRNISIHLSLRSRRSRACTRIRQRTRRDAAGFDCGPHNSRRRRAIAGDPHGASRIRVDQEVTRGQRAG
jgi:hypothetical protein